MTKLDELWVEVAKYQSIADDKGHGKTWAEMRELKTEKACREAEYAAEYAAADYAAANTAAFAAKYAAAADAAEYWMQEAIKRINEAIELAEKRK